MYEVYFYNIHRSSTGFKTWQEAMEHLKAVQFEGAVYDPEGDMILTWSPIEGLAWRKGVPDC